MIKSGYIKSKETGDHIRTLNDIPVDDFFPPELQEGRIDANIKLFGDKDIIIVTMTQPEDMPEKSKYGVNGKGEIIWELNKGNYLNVKHNFRGHYLDNNKKYWVVNGGGKYYQIDHKTGKVLDTKYENIDYEIHGNILKTEGENVIFEYNIERVYVYKNMMIVLLDISIKSCKNAFGVSRDGKILWNIGEVNNLKDVNGIQGLQFIGVVPRSPKDFWKYDLEEGELWVAQWAGWWHHIDHKTGKILETKIGR